MKANDITKIPGQNITLWAKIAIDLVKQAELSFLRENQEPDLLMTVFEGLVKSTDPMIRQAAIQIRIKANTGVFGSDGQTATPSAPADILVHIQTIVTLFRHLSESGDYAPLQEAINLKAHQATTEQVDQSLVQDRNTSAGGNTDGGKPRTASHGIPDNMIDADNKAIKEKEATLPERKHIHDDTVYCVTIGGKDWAKYCRHCGRFVKGRSMHTTKEHNGKFKFKYVEPDSSQSSSQSSTSTTQTDTTRNSTDGSDPTVSANMATTTLQNLDLDQIPVTDHPESLGPGTSVGLDQLFGSTGQLPDYETHHHLLEDELRDFEEKTREDERASMGIMGFLSSYLNF